LLRPTQCRSTPIATTAGVGFLAVVFGGRTALEAAL
jgi:hypothetical protein